MCAFAPLLPYPNRLLAALPAAEYTRIVPYLTPLALPAGAALHLPDAPFNAVYFPLTGVASVTVPTREGAQVEVGTIGREGMTGLSIVLGADRSPLRTLVQVPGDFARLPLPAFRAADAHGTVLHARLLDFVHAYYVMAAWSAACNRLHPTVQRAARWVLLTQDRVGAATFSLGREYLGYMVGVSRAGVLRAMRALGGAGLLTYKGDTITVVDRAGLEAASCECYATIRAAFPEYGDQ